MSKPPFTRRAQVPKRHNCEPLTPKDQRVSLSLAVGRKFRKSPVLFTTETEPNAHFFVEPFLRDVRAVRLAVKEQIECSVTPSDELEHGISGLLGVFSSPAHGQIMHFQANY